jgi:fatty acid amide hydrolase
MLGQFFVLFFLFCFWKGCLWLGAGLPLVFYAARHLYRQKVYKDYEVIYERKRAELNGKKSELRAKLSGFKISERVESKLLSLDACGIKEMLDGDEVTSEELVKFFTLRTLTIGEKYNIAVDFMYETAIAKARSIDLERSQLTQEERKNQPKLYGIPLSIKDTFVYKGTDTTLGQGSNCFCPKQETGFAVKNLEDHGLIPFIKTNVPQSLLINETVNFVFGRTKNPYDVERTSGGSSGGESASVLSRCSPIGFGSDGGGSVRIPANMCGLVGMKATARRTPNDGSMDDKSVRNEFVYWNMGPLCHSVRDAQEFVSCFLSKKAISQHISLPDLPWSPEAQESFKSKGKLRIGRCTKTLLLEPSSTNIRAIDMACEALKAQGHEIVEFEFDFEELVRIYLSYGLTVLRRRTSRFKGERSIKELNIFYLSQMIPNWFSKPISFILQLAGAQVLGSIFWLVKPRVIGMAEHWYLVNRQRAIEQAFFKKWDQLGLDCMISVAAGVPAFRHSEGKRLNLTAAYTFAFNLIDVPAGVVPVTHVSKGEEAYPVSRDLHKKTIRESLVGSEGLPVGIQVLGLPFRDEECMHVMALVEKGVNFKHLYATEK